MKKVTKRALSLTVSTLLLMNTFTATAFADNGDHEYHENNGHGYGHEYNKDWFENGHDNRDHNKQDSAEDEIVIELPEEQEEEQEEIQQVEEDQQEEASEENKEEAEETEEEETSEEVIEESEEEEASEEEIEESEEEEASEEVIEESEEEETSEEEIEESEEEEAAEEEQEEEASEEESEEIGSTIVEEVSEAIQEALGSEEETEEVREEEIEEVEEIEETEEVEEIVEEEAAWETYTLYNYISVNEGKTYISLNTQKDGIAAPKSAAEFHRENGNKKYNLSASEYEIDDYDLTEVVYTAGGISYVEESVAAEGQPYFIARLDRVEAVAAARFRASNCVEGIESFTSIENGTITFHRNWYLTLVTPMTENNKLLTGIRLGDGKNGNGNGKYYGIAYTENFKAVDSRTLAFDTKLSKDQYEIEDYDFTDLTLEFNGATYAYRPDGPQAGDGEAFHYYTVSFMKLDKLAKSTYSGGYLVKGWPTWPLINTKLAGEDGFPFQAGYFHRDYQVTLLIGDAPAAIVEEVEETPAVEEIAPVEEVKEEAPVEEPVIEEIVEETKVEEEIREDEEIVEETKAEEEIKEDEEIVEESEVEEEPVVEETPITKVVLAMIEKAIAEEIEAPVEEEASEIVEDEPEVIEEEALAVEETAATEEEAEMIEEIAQVEEEPAAAIVEDEPAVIEEETPAVEETAEIEETAEMIEEIAQAEEEPAAAIVEDEPVVIEEETPAVEETAEIEEAAEMIEEITQVEEEEAAEEMIFAAAETKTPAKSRKNASAANESIMNEGTTNQPESIVEVAEDEILAIAEAETYAAGMTIEEEILEEEMPLAAAPFEAVTAAAQVETVKNVEVASVEAPSFIEVASMQVADFVEMTEAEVPAAAAGTWSLASMIFGAMSLLLAIFTLASKSISRGLKIAAAALAAATAVIILVTSDLNGMMVTADKGTLAVVILNIFEAVFASTASNEARLG